MRKAIWILWPSFVVAGIANALVFTFFDPQESRLAWYSLGFAALWACAAASSAFTCFLQRTAAEINRCPLQPIERPVGCLKRQDPDAAC